MGQFKRLFESLSLRQKLSIAIAVLAAGAAIAGIMHWRKEQDFKPLYTGLAPEDASAMVQKLKESGIEYRVSDSGDAVLAPSGRIAETRLLLAGAGLPKSGRLGFELFDKSNFGLTDFAERVNFRRAIEGELERSILALSDVEQARVHVTFPKDSVFVESREAAKASVMLRLRPGRRLTGANVTAIAQLVAAAVDGLTPESVSVVDTLGNLLSRPHRDSADTSGAYEDYRQSVESELLAKINRTLEPVLGANRFRAGVSVECDSSTREETEEVVDPNRTVVVNTQKTEETSSSAGSAGVPGTPSNLPRPAVAPSRPGAGTSRKTENTAYQNSRVVRHVQVPRGEVKRLSIAVLVDQTITWEGTGPAAKRIVTPPAPEKLKVIRDLVAGVAGLNAARGDQLVVDTLPFESNLLDGPPPAATPGSTTTPAQTAVKPPWRDPAILGVAAALLLTLFIFLRKPRRANAPVRAPVALPAPGKPAMTRSEFGDAEQQAHKATPAKSAEAAAPHHRLESKPSPDRQLPAAPASPTEVLLDEIREGVRSDPAASVQLLRTWLLDETKG